MATIVEVQTFKHEELPDARTYIRLLEIISVDETRGIPVHCKLTTWPKADVPTYTAISYTWGDPGILAVILVNGKRIQKRRNCEDVLRQPCRDEGGYFWIDGICINQMDNKEKSFQVASMSDVYREARQVLACVGRHGDDSEFLFRKLHRHRRFWKRFCTPNVVRVQIHFCQTPRRRYSIVKLFDAFKKFLQRTYFKRVWIYQELYFGQDIQICCQDQKVELSTLRVLYLTFQKLYYNPKHPIPLEHHSFPTLAGPLPNATPLLEAEIMSKTQIPFSQMIWDIGDFQCKDPRDRIFGILAMAEWEGMKPIQPDYGKDRFDLAVEVLERLGQTRPALNSRFSLTLLVTRLLNLPGQTSIRLADEMQKRQSQRFEHPPVNPITKTRQAVSMWTQLWGTRLYLHNASWQVQSENLADDNRFPTIEQWSKGHVWDVRKTGVLLPQEVQPHDWLSIPPRLMASKEQYLTAFIARDDCDGRLRLVDKAFFVGWADWPTALRWQNRGFMYDVHLDPEDAIVLAYSRNWDDWDYSGAGLWMKDDDEAHEAQVDDYFGTRLAGDESCSYAARV